VVPTGKRIPVPANGGATEGKLNKTKAAGDEKQPESAKIALQSLITTTEGSKMT